MCRRSGGQVDDRLNMWRVWFVGLLAGLEIQKVWMAFSRSRVCSWSAQLVCVGSGLLAGLQNMFMVWFIHWTLLTLRRSDGFVAGLLGLWESGHAAGVLDPNLSSHFHQFCIFWISFVPQNPLPFFCSLQFQCSRQEVSHNPTGEDKLGICFNKSYNNLVT